MVLTHLSLFLIKVTVDLLVLHYIASCTPVAPRSRPATIWPTPGLPARLHQLESKSRTDKYQTMEGKVANVQALL